MSNHHVCGIYTLSFVKGMVYLKIKLKVKALFIQRLRTNVKELHQNTTSR